jgi:putative ABC transport system ATP-binding protein
MNAPSTGDRPLVLHLADVVKEFPGSPPVRAVDGVSLDVRTGEFVGIVGSSGSGKSTLLNLIGALDQPTSGTVALDGIDIGQLGDKDLSAVRGRLIGFVFQSFNLIDGVDAVENVGLGLTYAGVSRRERVRRAKEALEMVGLGHRSDHRPSRLSGGERQRVAVARALVTNPTLLLADEPTGALDSRNSAAIVELFHDLHAQGVTIVLITHDSSLASSLPRCVTILDGRIVGDDALAAVS